MGFYQRIAAVAGLACLTVGCQGYPFQYVPASQAQSYSTQNYVSGSPATDILFVVDNSPSMADKQANLQANAAAFINTVANSNNDYHIGIVTTDLFASTDNGRLRMDGTGNPMYLSRGAGDANAVQNVIAHFTATVGSLGIAGSNAEAAIGAALAALDPNHPDAAALNTGFYRQDADLAIIFVTDEDDCTFQPQYAGEQSFWEIAASCYENTSQLQTVDSLVKFFVSLKGGNVAKVRAALIGGGTSGQNGGTFKPSGCMVGASGGVDTTCGCWTYSNDDYFCSSLNTYDQQACTSVDSCSDATCPSVPGGTCDTARCSATPSRRYFDFINALTAERQAAGVSNGTFADSICQNDYKQSLLSIANTVVQTSCFTIAQAANNPNDVTVQVSHVDAAGGRTQPTTLPRFDPNDTTAQCHSCGDCASGAWQMTSSTSVCLVCNTAQNTGDDFQVNVYDPNSAK